MSRLLGLLSLVAAVSLASGCAMCCHPYDEHYLYQGGRWVRDIPDRGRVGSAFEEAGHRVDDIAETQVEQPPVQTLPAPQRQPDPNSRLVPPAARGSGGGMTPYLPTE